VVESLRHLSSGLAAALSAALVTVTLSAWPALAAGSVNAMGFRAKYCLA